MWSSAETRRENYSYSGQGQSDHATENHRQDRALLGFTEHFGFFTELNKKTLGEE